MLHILDRFSVPKSQFRPKTVQEYFALQLARKLDDQAQVLHYVALVDQRSEETLVRAYQRATARRGRLTLEQRFHVELDRNGHKEEYGQSENGSYRH